jgi:hypothetical protein
MGTVVSLDNQVEKIKQVLIQGDLKDLTLPERLNYYNTVCQSLGLNPLTKPFDFIDHPKSKKVILYATKNATDQLRKIYNISVTIKNRETVNGVHIVGAIARFPDGREDEATGAIFVAPLKGEDLANALMKAETKAKRRVTLSICGLGFLDETEVESIPQQDKAKEVQTVINPKVSESSVLDEDNYICCNQEMKRAKFTPNKFVCDVCKTYKVKEKK